MCPFLCPSRSNFIICLILKEILLLLLYVSSGLTTALMCLPCLKTNGCFKEFNSCSISPLFNTIVASSFFVLLLSVTTCSLPPCLSFEEWVSFLCLKIKSCLTRASLFFFGYRILLWEIQVNVYADYSRSSRNFLLSLGHRKPNCLRTCVFSYRVLNLICSKVNLKCFYQLQTLSILCFLGSISETWWIIRLYLLPFILL